MYCFLLLQQLNHCMLVSQLVPMQIPYVS
jgi:hypothetical protein